MPSTFKPWTFVKHSHRRGDPEWEKAYSELLLIARQRGMDVERFAQEFPEEFEKMMSLLIETGKTGEWPE